MELISWSISFRDCLITTRPSTFQDFVTASSICACSASNCFLTLSYRLERVSKPETSSSVRSA